MKILRSPSLQQSLPPAILAVSLLTAYLGTLAPGLTWANDGSDGGDLITAAATGGGVAHPTGYPLYLLLAKLFQLLPVGSLAYRTNLMSALATACAGLLVYAIVTHARTSSGPEPGWPAGMAAGYAFGLAPLVWSQAVITEVYALQAFLTALIVYLYTRPIRPATAGRKAQDSWRGLVLGLAMGNHVTTLLLVPAALLLGSVQDSGRAESTATGKLPWLADLEFDRSAFLRQLAAFVAGLTIYLTLPLRALGQPSVNWGNVVTPARFWWLVSGQLYQSYYLQLDLSGFWERAHAWAALLLDQFGLPGLVLGLTGLVVFGARSRMYILTGWIAALSLAFTVFYRSSDSHVYLIPMLLAFAIWVGLGAGGLIHRFRQRPVVWRVGIALLLAVYFVGRSGTTVAQIDASKDLRAEMFGQEVLSTAPEKAILFAKGDPAVFTLWYFHFALGERPDVAVVAVDLLHFDWYQENLEGLYPTLSVPRPFPWPETLARANAARPVCFIQTSDPTEIQCPPTFVPR